MQPKQPKRMVIGLAAATVVVLAAVMFAVGAPVASAATQTVQIPAGQNAFTAQKLTINVGDTITWKNNDVHNVVSANIPVGATAFESPMMMTPTDSFSQTFTVPGNYRYLCTLHASPADANAATQSATKMVGEFTVVGTATTPPTGVPTVVPTVVPPVVPVVPTGRTVRIEADSDEWSPKRTTGVKIGDSIRFTDLKDDHDAVSTAIPVGAARFAYNQGLDEDDAEEPKYLVTLPGVYNFLCTQHDGMTASFTTAGFIAPVPVPTTPPVVTPPSGAVKTVQISAGQNAFTPKNLGNINVGDTITWKNNDMHNVVSANIPAGATAFESPFLTGATASFSQTFTVPGNYRYLCTLHAAPADANAATQGSAMVGQFTVVAGTTAPPSPPVT